jgi:hypothetical protein
MSRDLIMKRIIVLLLGCLSIVLPTTTRQALACPFCSAVSQTLRQEMAVMDAIAIAEATSESVRDETTGKVKLKVISVLKGEKLVKPDEIVTAVYYGAVEPGRRFMLSGADPEEIQWACLPINETSEEYLLKITKLPDDPLERLKFYQDYLQHPESMLNRDAYDEFAITPYPVVQALKPFMKRDQLVAWISDPEMPADRKRLYLTMLGVCGDESDVPMLDEMLRSTQPTTRGGLDALIACYLVLSGEKGLPTIDEMFLKNPKAPYADTYAAIMAIRFHGTETDKIPRSSLVQSLHHVLDRKDLADLVIPDLARWGDWSQIDRLEKLFIEAEKDNNWIRVPVVNYLRACPKPEAEAALKRLKEVDPESVKRASSFFSIPTPAPAASPSTSLWFKRERNPAVARGIPSELGKLEANAKIASLPFAPRTEHAFAIAHGLKTQVSDVQIQRLVASSNAPPTLLNRLSLAGVPLVTLLSLVLCLHRVLCGRGLHLLGRSF